MYFIIDYTLSSLPHNYNIKTINYGKFNVKRKERNKTRLQTQKQQKV